VGEGRSSVTPTSFLHLVESVSKIDTLLTTPT
jgi:hypothetical protein